MGDAACRGPRERHSPGPNLALNGPGRPRLRRRSTAHLEQSAGRDLSQPISGCLNRGTGPRSKVAAYCYRCSVVAMLVTGVSCAKTDKLIEMSFGVWTRAYC